MASRWFSARSMVGRGNWLVLAALVGAASPGVALADPPLPREVGVPALGRSLAGNDQSSSLATNPANLAFLTDAELRWTWVRTNPGSTDSPGSPDPGRGHAFDLAVNLFRTLGTGFRFDFVRPASSVASPFNHPYNWFTWGVGIRASDGLAFGLSIARSYSEDSRLAAATSVSAAISARPSPFLGLSIVGRNLNSPRTKAGMSLDPEVGVGVAIRPTGRRDLEIGLEDRYVDATEQWLPRGTLGLDLPYVGRLRGEVALSDPTAPGPLVYMASAGLEVGWGTASVEGGAVFGSMVHGAEGAGFYTGAAITAYRNPGLPEGTYGVRIRIENTPGGRAHVHLLQRLWKMASDPELRAVALLLKSEPADSLAHAEELADAIRMLRANGKKVACHMEDAKGRALYVCSQADRVYLHPAGVIRFAGLGTQHLYFASLLEKLGVRAQFVRVGAHKTAPEQFMRDGGTDVARADHLDMLKESNDVFLSDVGGGRHVPMATLAESLGHGPFLAGEAKQAGLIDQAVYEDEIEGQMSRDLSEKTSLQDEPRRPTAPARFGTRRRIAIVYVEGDMIDGRSRTIPLVGTQLAGSYTIVQALKKAREDASVAAVVMRIESPGGSSIGADAIWHEARLTANAKPLIVSMGKYAASGGYYIATAGHSVWANPLTVTGSIGIYFGKVDMSGLLRKIGVSVEAFRSTPRADGDSLFRPYTPDELSELEHKVRQLYDLFLDRVSQGRGLSKEDVDKVGQGRVWTGRQALDRHLVDHLGGIREALAEARTRAGLPYDAPIEELPVPETSLAQIAAQVAGIAGVTIAPAAEAGGGLLGLAPTQLVELVSALAPLSCYESDEPLARMELVPVSEP